MDLQIHHRTLQGADVPTLVLTVVGVVDTYTAAVLHEQLTAAVAQPHHLVVLDSSGVAFMDSAGLSVLAGALKRSRAQASQLRLAGLQPVVSRVMTITGLIKSSTPTRTPRPRCTAEGFH